MAVSKLAGWQLRSRSSEPKRKMPFSAGGSIEFSYAHSYIATVRAAQNPNQGLTLNYV